MNTYEKLTLQDIIDQESKHEIIETPHKDYSDYMDSDDLANTEPGRWFLIWPLIAGFIGSVVGFFIVYAIFKAFHLWF